MRRNHEETSTPEPHTGFQGESGHCGHQGRSHACAACGAVRRASQPDHDLESATRRRSGRCFRSRAYCEDLGIGLAEYRRRFAAATVAFLDHSDYAPVEYHPEHTAEHKDRRTVAGTFRLAIEEAAKRHPAAEPLIVRAALLAPEPIPLFLFAEGREKFGEPLATAFAGDDLDKAVAALRTFALVDRDSIVYERDPAIRTETIRLH